ncbi:MAG TPA: hypothetical protein VGM90_19410 [Kofleriaceae bacterium]
MNRDLHPTEGARYLLERATDDGARATYRAVIYLPASEYETIATLGDDGSVSIAECAAPKELVDRLANMAKVVARDASKLRTDGMPPWPSRVLRWRK